MFEELKQQIREQVLVAEVLVKIVAIWIASDIGFYSAAALSGAGSGFSTHPFVLAAYYVCWVGVTFAIFWNFYKGWEVAEVRPSLFFVLSLGIAGITVYLLYIFPLFPAIQWAPQLEPPSELFSASPWYFLPKSLEIALQQLLVAAMVLAFNRHKLSLKKISGWSATLFGGIHLLLVFSGSSLAYIAVFTLSAVVAGFVFPYLMLRVRNGFVYSYFLHWAFYAVVIILARVLFKV